MTDDRLIYTNPADIIKMASEKGFSDYQIIVKLVQGTSYKETVLIAKKWHPFLGISYGSFMKMARGRNW